MDIARKSSGTKQWFRKRWVWGVAAALVVVVVLTRTGFGSAAYSVDKDDVVIGTVQRGDFSVQVRGIGVLVPKDIHLLAVNVDGLVERINVEAGAAVKKGDVVAILSNPRLNEQLLQAQWEIDAQIKQNRAAESMLRSQLADLRSEAKNAELDYLSVKVKYDAEKKLVEQKIVSRITAEQSRIVMEQNFHKIEAQTERVKRMQESLAATTEANVSVVSKLEKSKDLIQQQIDDLTIRAGIDGVVQQMSLQLGQRVTAGTQAGQIARQDDLVALLDVQDFQINDVALQQTVVVDTRTSKIPGRVARIAPSATNGVVKVEVVLTGKMPPEARPDLSVEGIIDIEKKRNALFVERPPFAKSQGKVELYRLDGSEASRRSVQFGRASTRYIEVLGGLQPGDQVIVSDSSAWSSHDKISVK
ncbi:efflux RND transporter periplasmic adaptor subunit [Xanthomonas sp. SS]|uniref:efflux RND transporter periplasmic adaptor subunit n=1 Tax=Xanthomonas sp. SS TaxID=2724122 RepID=UPI00163B05A9|nr:HlyD family efflux transporter periplasmic adaptor subunit [Xanthomonas sp. SS]QNH16240.1 efflux RND transporter periplasmic adaptor subunit [Xanthomonas sp. SS]